MYGKIRAQQASASSFESLRAATVKGGVATESLGSNNEIELKEAQAAVFVEDAIVDLLLDGHIFFSLVPEEAYNQLLTMLQDETVKYYIVKALARHGNLSEDVDLCNVLRQRLHKMEQEAGCRSAELEAMRERLVDKDPAVAELIY